MSISMEHAALVEMFRSNPGLVPQLLRDSFAVALPAWETVSIAEAELDQLAPIEFRADLVVELANAGAPRLGAVVEVQLSADDDKRFSWPVYLTVNRSRRRCETLLLVVAPDPAVAAWARRPIRVGPDNEVRVHVLGPAEIPAVLDPSVGLANPQLAVLSAMAHGNEPELGLPVLRSALAALDAFDKVDARLYLHLIYKALEEPMRRALKEEKMLRGQYPDVELELPGFVYDMVERGEARGEVRGEMRGEVRGEAKVLLKILERNGVVLTPEQRRSIASCEDPSRIDAWVERAFTARTADELFADG